MLPATFQRLLRARGPALLLAWALCLPFAQWASATHALLHLHSVASEQSEAPEELPAFCDLCVVAATLDGAAPLPVANLPAALALPAAPPALDAAAPPPPAAPFTAFHSRAPPSLPA
jgi:hypothetical protein